MKIFNPKATIKKRRELRKNQTDVENKIWSIIRNKKIKGYKFHRQFGVGFYIIDFYCPLLKLAIEIDGGQHFEDKGLVSDRLRKEFLEGKKIKILRYTNLDVLKNIEGVYDDILKELPHPPLYEKEGV